MSKSLKKTPGVCDRNPYCKNQANRKVRRIPYNFYMNNGKMYKKFYGSYNICDYKILYFYDKNFLDVCYPFYKYARK